MNKVFYNNALIFVCVGVDVWVQKDGRSEGLARDCLHVPDIRDLSSNVTSSFTIATSNTKLTTALAEYVERS